MKAKIKKLHPLAEIPQYMTPGAAGCDVRACLDDPLCVEPMQRVAVPTGLSVEIPQGFEIQVRPRSGLAFKEGLTVVNAPGTIDSDYRGEVKVLLINLGVKPVEIKNKDRIAQLVCSPVVQMTWEQSENLADTTRGAGGFGSTGT